MKNLLIYLFALSIGLFSFNLNAGISTTAQWELRTTGNNNNGGFFNGAGSSPGTDFSQQDAAQYTFSDLASTNASTTCVVTSASHNFVAADNRNGLHISAGTSWTTGWYEIISVSANAATLDRACGSVASVSGGTYFVGGGLLTPGGVATALGTGCGSGNAANVCGTINIKNGTYTVTATTTINASTTWQGYLTTHGDNGTPPTITTATNSTDLFHTNQVGAAALCIFDNLILTNTAVTPANGIIPTSNGVNPNYLGVRNVSFSGFTHAIDSQTTQVYQHLDLAQIEVKNSTSVGIQSSGTLLVCVACWIHNNSGAGITTININSRLVIVNSLITNNTQGIGGQGDNTCINSDISNNSSDGVQQTGSGGVANFSSYNCIYYGNGGWGVNLAIGGNLPFNISETNAYGSNTSGPRNNFNVGLNDVALTANPFTSATNFALNSAAGGGAAINNNGFPGVFPGATTTGTIAIGAVQASSGGGGGGGNGSGTIIYVK